MHKFVITQHPEDITVFISNEIFTIIESERGGAFPKDDIFALDSLLKFDDGFVFLTVLNSLNKSSEDYSPLETIVKHLKMQDEIIYYPS